MTGRAGFVSLIGRPNAGKSTLLNRLVGEKLSIVSARPQTTRNRITGIKNLPHAQVIFVDTPGLHPAAGKLGHFMLTTARRSVEDVDVVCLVVDAPEGDDPGEIVLDPLRRYAGPVFCVLNKVDRVRPKSRMLPLIEHPPFFPLDATSDQPETFFVAEMIREKVFHLTREEVPYAVAVRVEELTERERPACIYARATIFVEQDSQKGILIGKGGAMLKQIGTAARRDLEAFFGIKVFLQSTVEVRRHWRRDERALREFGFRLTS